MVQLYHKRVKNTRIAEGSISTVGTVIIDFPIGRLNKGA
jgi:hypothetical protein